MGEPRYNSSDFEEFIPEGFVPDTNRSGNGVALNGNGEELVLDPNAQAPTDELLAAFEGNKRARDTWNKKRNDFTDKSQSVYDLALANLGVDMGLDDQTIANMIIHHRRKWGEDLEKVTHGNRAQVYMRDTIGKARARERLDQAAEAASKQVEEGMKALSEPADEASKSREAVFKAASQVLGTDIADLRQYGQTDATFHLCLADGTEFEIGTAQELLNQSHVRARLLERTRRVIPNISRKAWLQLIETLVQAATIIQQPEAEPGEELRGWLQEYVTPDRLARSERDWMGAALQKEPFLRDNLLHIHFDEFRKYVLLFLNLQWPLRRWRSTFRKLGFEPRSISVRTGGGPRDVKTRGFWVGPYDAVKSQDEDAE